MKVPVGHDLKKGQNYFLSNTSSTVSRKSGVGFSFSYVNNTTITENEAGSTEVKSSILGVVLEYAFNMQSFEAGPLLGMSRTSSGSNGEAVESAYAIGAFGEYNFMENKLGQMFVPAVQVQVAYMSMPSTSVIGATTTETSKGGLFWTVGVLGKLFMTESWAFLIKADYGGKSLSGQTTIGAASAEFNQSVGEFKLSAGIRAYF